MSLPKGQNLVSFLTQLFDTNDEFASLHDESFFAKFHDSQNPKLTILKCSDSRVQMESFDKTPQNGVFAIRNIGNQVVTCEGSIDFGVEVLNTPFLLIVGHSDCGAVTAVVNGVTMNSSCINKELSTIKIKSKTIKEGIIENINFQVERAVQKYQYKIDIDELVVLGAVYDFKNDFGYGHGRLVLTSVNGISDYQKVASTYANKVKNLHFFSNIKEREEV